MERRILGKTGIAVSPITIGAWQLGGPLAFDGKPDGHPDPGREKVIRLIHELEDLGVNAIDTAEQYSAGESERRVGEALRGRRDRWVISTKFGYRVGPNHTREDDSSPETILPSLEGSLTRLGTDYIDVYLYHCAPAVEEIEAGRAVLEQARAQGKIRAYGISTNDLALLERMAGQHAVEVVQFHTNLLEPFDGVWALAREHRLGTQIRGIMAQGRLSGNYFNRQPSFRSDDTRSNWSDQVDFTRYAVLAESVPEGMTMAQAMVRWALDRPGADTVCLGAKGIEDYRAAVRAVEMPPLETAVREGLEQTAAGL